MRLEIANNYDIPLNRTKINDPIIKARKIAAVYLNHYDVIPEKRREELLIQFTEFANIKNPNKDIFNEYIEKYSDYDTLNHGEEVVKILLENDEIENFMRMWRQHFLDSMNPKYMPKFWSVDRKHEM